MSVNTSAIAADSSCLHASSFTESSYALLGGDDTMRSRTLPPPPLMPLPFSSTHTNNGGTMAEEKGDSYMGSRPPTQPFSGVDRSCGSYHHDPSFAVHHQAQSRTMQNSVELTGYHANAGATDTTPVRHAELRELLITTERELAEMREECARRSAEVDALRVALGREQEVNHNAQARHEESMRELREEHADQTQRLMDQITLLKRLSEGLMEEKSRLAEDASQRKQQLLALLDREREEKSQIMADYRQQTEALIADQGKEITSLRNTQQSLREEQERILSERQELEETKRTLEEKILQLGEKITNEQMECEKKIQETNQRHARKMDELVAKNEELSRRLEDESSKLQERRQELEDHVRSLAERLRCQEETHTLEQQNLKETYKREVSELREELQTMMNQREQLEEEHEKDRQKLLKNEEKLIQSLRQAVEEVRQEKEALAEEAARQQEEMQEKHWAKVNQLQNTAESLRRQLAEETAVRKEAESERELVAVRADGLQSTVSRLTNELETLQVEHRARERAAGQERQNSLEQLRSQLRERAAEVEALQQEVARHEMEENRLRDELAAKVQALQSTRAEGKRLLEEMQQTAEDREREMLEREGRLEKAIMLSRAQKTQVEAECQRLQRAITELEKRQQTCEKQLEDERRALEEATATVQQLRDEAEEQKSVFRRTQTRQHELEEELRRKSNDLAKAASRVEELEASLEAANSEAAQQSKEALRAAKVHEVELQSLIQRQQAEVTAMRLAADQIRGDFAKAREVAAAKEEELHRLREEVNQLHRDAETRAGSWQGELAESRELHEEDMRRMDEVLYTMRADLSRAQAAKAQCQKEMAQFQREAERQRLQLEDMLSQMEAAKEKLQEDARYREQLNIELQGTVKLLTSRLTAQEDDIRRMQEELADVNTKLHNAHTFLGRKDAAIGQLTARLRAYEARIGVSFK
ncbi:hypothetical protein TcYC6_0055040 [Trypanosoma cruzi]|nr:hypothetical protein TcYC6_0055040 [Trypanosoma cruzi]